MIGRRDFIYLFYEREGWNLEVYRDDAVFAYFKQLTDLPLAKWGIAYLSAIEGAPKRKVWGTQWEKSSDWTNRNGRCR